MISDQMVITIIDFDQCTNLDKKVTKQLGTPGYLAPERQDDDPSYDGAPADIFALGVMLYALDL